MCIINFGGLVWARTFLAAGEGKMPHGFPMVGLRAGWTALLLEGRGFRHLHGKGKCPGTLGACAGAPLEKIRSAGLPAACTWETPKK